MQEGRARGEQAADAAGDTGNSLRLSLVRAARALAELSVETMCYDEIREGLCTVSAPVAALSALRLF